ncbi:MAG: hypothetical protein ACLVJB_06675 [Christensenellales bacterium]
MRGKRAEHQSICPPAQTIEEALEAVHQIEKERETLDFLIDGATIKITDMRTREVLGTTDKFPRWSIAFKFPAQETVTKLLKITWEVGRTGKLTPLAHLFPVDICGVTVKRATLNNYDDICRKRVRIEARFGYAALMTSFRKSWALFGMGRAKRRRRIFSRRRFVRPAADRWSN